MGYSSGNYFGVVGIDLGWFGVDWFGIGVRVDLGLDRDGLDSWVGWVVKREFYEVN